MLSRIVSGALVVLGILSAPACASHVDADRSGQSSGTAGAGGAGTSTGTAGDHGTGGAADAGDTGDASALDGTPTRQACTGDFGMGLTATHGRMDGYLVSIIPPGQGQQCNGDSGHVHLQVQIAGAIYDVAVNTDVLYDELDVALAGGAWAEGWHAGQTLDYVSNLGLHKASFTTTDPTALAQMVETQLADVNHISVFGTGYGPTGAHDIHRQEGVGEDGAIAINPLSPKAHLLTFCFTTDSF